MRPPRRPRSIVPYSALAQYAAPPASQAQPRTAPRSAKFWAMLLVLLLAAAAGNELRHWHHSAVARERAAAAQREAERRATCALVARAVSVAEGQGRQDLGEVKDGLPPCLRAVDCRYLIELDIALIAGGREDLVAQLRKALYAAPCDDGLDFARKHGLPAYASGDLSRHQQVAS